MQQRHLEAHRTEVSHLAKEALQLQTIRNEAAWAALSSEWNELLARSISNVPFLSYEYLKAWWQHRGGGEWPQAELQIITARDAAHQLVGVAPFFLNRDAENKASLRLIGSLEISDFLDIMVQESDLNCFAEALMGYLHSEAVLAWDQIILSNILDTSPSLVAMKQAAEARGLLTQLETLQASPLIPLPGNFEDYVNGLDKKHRHEFRRKLRNAAGFFIPVTWHIHTDSAVLDDAMGNFFSLMEQEKEKQSFLSPEMRTQMKAIAQAFNKMGALQLAFLKVGDQLAGAYFNICYDKRIWVYNSGTSKQFAQLSPGMVLIGYLIENAIEQGFNVFDMMRGDEAYKYQLGAVDRFVKQLVLTKK